MGSFIEVNDTLQLTKAQGFPKELKLAKHQKKPFKPEDFKKRIFEFKNKDGLRVYHSPPVRVFFAENINEKWIYWGLVEIIELKWDCLKRLTSGKFRIIHLYQPEEMKQVFQLIDRRRHKNYFKK